MDYGTIIQAPVSILEIDDERYRFTRGNPSDEITSQIAEWGCLVPPICASEGDRLIPVAGFKRLRACVKASGPDAHVEVRRLDQGKTSLELLVIGAHDILRDRKAGAFEIARAVRLALNEEIPREEISGILLPALGCDPHEVVIKRHLELESIPECLAGLLEEKGISVKRALTFVTVGASEAEVLLQIVEALHLSARALEEWSRMIADISLRDQVSWQEVVESVGLLHLLYEDLPLASKVRMGRERLWALRYPTWDEIERKARCRAQQTATSNRMRFSWDRQFEEEGLELTLTVRDVDTLREDLAALLEADRLDIIRSLLDLLGGTEE